MKGYPEYQDELDCQLVVDCTQPSKVRGGFVFAFYVALIVFFVVQFWRLF